MTQQSFLQKLKTEFNSLLGKTNKAIESGKTQIEMQQLKAKISGVQKEIGKYIYEKHIAKENSVSLNTDDVLIEKLKDISFYQSKIDGLEEQ
jgi:hypothetical protein